MVPAVKSWSVSLFYKGGPPPVRVGKPKGVLYTKKEILPPWGPPPESVGFFVRKKEAPLP